MFGGGGGFGRTGGFGAKPAGAFGAPAAAGAFGAPAGGGFGAPATATPAAFGAPGGFGAKPAGAFGAPAATGAFGAPAGGFGAKPAYGATPAVGGFGAPTATAAAGSPYGTQDFRFQHTLKNETTKKKGTLRFHMMTLVFHARYAKNHKTQVQLRVEDFLISQGQNPAAGVGGGAPVTAAAPAAGAFGAKPAGAFGAPAATGAFGAPAATGGFGAAAGGFGAKPAFGAAPAAGAFGAPAATAGFGAKPAGAFGAPAATGAFGAATGGFGAASGGFGAKPAGGFGAPAATGAFGAPAATGAFGAKPAGAFGAPAATGAFGAKPAGAFGAPAATGAFGAPAATGAFGAKPAGAFGAPAATGAFGAPAATGAFGAPAATGAFGAKPAGAFGAPAATGAFGAKPAGAFGAPAATGAFGAKPAGTFGAAGAFGAKPAGAFGAPAATGAFGAPAATGAFGAKPAGTFGAPAATGAFGAKPPGTFGAPAATGFGAQPFAAAGAFAPQQPVAQVNPNLRQPQMGTPYAPSTLLTLASQGVKGGVGSMKPHEVGKGSGGSNVLSLLLSDPTHTGRATPVVSAPRSVPTTLFSNSKMSLFMEEPKQSHYHSQMMRRSGRRNIKRLTVDPKKEASSSKAYPNATPLGTPFSAGQSPMGVVSTSNTLAYNAPGGASPAAMQWATPGAHRTPASSLPPKSHHHHSAPVTANPAAMGDSGGEEASSSSEYEEEEEEEEVVVEDKVEPVVLSSLGVKTKEKAKARSKAVYGCPALPSASDWESSADIPNCPVILTRAGYFTIPSLKTLAGLPKEEQEAFEGFTVGCHGLGCITVPGVVNLVGLNIDVEVNFLPKTVEVYPSDDTKPPRGEVLNQFAEIWLFNVFPKSASSTSPATGAKLQKFETKLVRASQKADATFLSYNPAKGHWCFTVDHFSKYGLLDDDDDDDDDNDEDVAMNGSLPPLPTAVAKSMGNGNRGVAFVAEPSLQRGARFAAPHHATTSSHVSFQHPRGASTGLPPRAPMMMEDDLSVLGGAVNTTAYVAPSGGRRVVFDAPPSESQTPTAEAPFAANSMFPVESVGRSLAARLMSSGGATDEAVFAHPDSYAVQASFSQIYEKQKVLVEEPVVLPPAPTPHRTLPVTAASINMGSMAPAPPPAVSRDVVAEVFGSIAAGKASMVPCGVEVQPSSDLFMRRSFRASFGPGGLLVIPSVSATVSPVSGKTTSIHTGVVKITRAPSGNPLLAGCSDRGAALAPLLTAMHSVATVTSPQAPQDDPRDTDRCAPDVGLDRQKSLPEIIAVLSEGFSRSAAATALSSREEGCLPSSRQVHSEQRPSSAQEVFALGAEALELCGALFGDATSTLDLLEDTEEQREARRLERVGGWLRKSLSRGAPSAALAEPSAQESVESVLSRAHGLLIARNVPAAAKLALSVGYKHLAVLMCEWMMGGAVLGAISVACGRAAAQLEKWRQRDQATASRSRIPPAVLAIYHLLAGDVYGNGGDHGVLSAEASDLMMVGPVGTEGSGGSRARGWRAGFGLALWYSPRGSVSRLSHILQDYDSAALAGKVPRPVAVHVHDPCEISPLLPGAAGPRFAAGVATRRLGACLGLGASSGQFIRDVEATKHLTTGGEREASSAPLDVCYHLMWCAAERGHPMSAVVGDGTCSPYAGGGLLPVILRAVMLRAGFPDLKSPWKLHLQAASQLERLGLWQWAAAIMLWSPVAASVRSRAVREILGRAASLLLPPGSSSTPLGSQVAQWKAGASLLVDSLEVPQEWVDEAESWAARAQFKVRLQFSKISGIPVRAPTAHNLVVHHLATPSLFSGDHSGVKNDLERLVGSASRIGSPWDAQGETLLAAIELLEVFCEFELQVTEGTMGGTEAEVQGEVIRERVAKVLEALNSWGTGRAAVEATPTLIALSEIKSRLVSYLSGLVDITRNFQFRNRADTLSTCALAISQADVPHHYVERHLATLNTSFLDWAIA